MNTLTIQVVRAMTLSFCAVMGLTMLLQPAAAQNTASQQVIIETMRALDLKTSEELLEAVDTLSNVGAHAEAKKYLQKLAQTNLAGPDKDKELIRLYKKLGPSFFLRLSRNKNLEPLGRAIADQAIAATKLFNVSPERIAELIQSCIDNSPDKRSIGLSGIRDAGIYAAPPLIQAITRNNDPKLRGRLENALVALGDDAVPPLLGALRSPNPLVSAHAAAALSRLKDEQAMMHTLYLAVAGPDPYVQSVASEAVKNTLGTPSVAAAKVVLRGRVLEMLQGDLQVRWDRSDDEVVVWRWSEKHMSVLPQPLPIDTANALLALDLAYDLKRLSHGDNEANQLYLATAATAAKLSVGIDEPINLKGSQRFASLLRINPHEMESVLQYALRKNLPATAVAAAETLGIIGSEKILNGYQGTPRPLALALRHRNRRVRFAAAQAIMEIGPIGPFAGAGDFQNAIAHFIATEGYPRAMVLNTRNQQSNMLAGMLRDAGYDADIVTNGRDALKLVAKIPDYELIVIADTVPRWSEWVQQFRRDIHSGALPIGIVATGNRLGRAEGLAVHDDLTVAFPMPQEQANLSALVAELVRFKKPTPNALKIKHAKAALGWMEQLAASRNGVFDLIDYEPVLIETLLQPELSSGAARVLGYLGTPKAQSALAVQASQTSGSELSRRMAARALDVAIGRQGVQLTSSQVTEQYDRYNTAESLDSSTEEILGSILDAIERGPTVQGL